MADEVKIGLSVDPKGVAQGTSAAEKSLTKLEGKSRDANVRWVKASQAAGSATKKLADDVGVAKKATEGLGDSGLDSFRKFQHGADQAANATKRINTESRKIGKRGSFIEQAAPKALNSVTSLVAGGSILLAAKQSMDFNAQLTMMGVNARDAQGKLNGKDFAPELAAMRQEIMGVAQQMGQSPNQLLEAMNAIVERTGDLPLARQELKLMADTAMATGSDLGDVGALVSNLGEKANVSAGDMRKALEILVAQGKTGAFTMKQLATEGEELFAVFPQFQKKGEAGLRSFGAFIQMAMVGTGKAPEAATAIKALAADLADVTVLQEKMKKAGIHGVKFFDRKGVKRSTEDIVKDMIIAAKGSADKLSVAFTESSRSAVLPIAKDYADGKGFARFESFKQSDGKGIINDDAKTNLQEANAQLDIFMQKVRGFADEKLKSPLEYFKADMTFINEHAEGTKRAFEVIGIGVGALALQVGALKIKEFNNWMKEAMSAGKNTTTGADGKQKSFALGGVQQVFITNWPAGGAGGGPSYYDDTPSAKPKPAGGSEPSVKPRGRIGRVLDGIKSRIGTTRMGRAFSSVAKVGSKGLPAIKSLAKSGLGTGLILGAGDMALNGGFTGENVAGMLGGTIGGLAGIAGGGGLASLPFGIAGGIAGDKAGRWIYNDFFANNSAGSNKFRPEVWNPDYASAKETPTPTPMMNMELNVSFDKDGRATTTVTGKDAGNVNLRPSLTPAWGAR